MKRFDISIEPFLSISWNASRECLAILDRDGIVLQLNPHWQQVFNLDPETLLGLAWFDCIDVDHRSRLMAAWQQLLISYEPIETYCRFQVANQVHWLDIHIKPISDSEVFYFSALATPHLDEYASLPMNDQLATLRALGQHAPFGIGVFDRAYSYCYLNQVLAAINGFTIADHIGKSIQEILPIAPQIAPLLEQVFTNGVSIEQYEIQGQTYASSDDQRIWMCHFFPIYSDVTIEYVGCTITETTSNKHHEEALLKAISEAEKAHRAKNVILNNMSHEIRTPLTNMIGYASLLARKLDQRQKLQAERIVESGQRLANTLNSVLLLAHLESDTYLARLSTKLFKIAIIETLEPYEKQAMDKGLTWVISIAPELETYQDNYDFEAFKTILQHIISNAIKFTPSGTITIDARLALDTEELYITVKDTGIGIDQDFQAVLFEPFRQQSTGLNRNYEGSGLGLAVTMRLVEVLKGTLNIKSPPHEGTTVEVCLPLAYQKQSGPLILVIEDNPDTAELLAEILEALGEVHIATNAQTGIQQATGSLQTHGRAFNLIVMDIHLGRSGSGIDVLNTLRAIPEYHTTPMLAVTAFALPDERSTILSEGFTEHLAKPFDPQDLEILAKSLINS